MKIIRNDEIYIPIYRAKNEIFDEDYDNLLKLYQKSFKVQSKDFQSLYDCLSIQLMYWLSDFEEERDPKMMDRLLFEIKGLDFYRFFYNDLEWYPYLILDKHDGIFLNDDRIFEVKYDIEQEAITFFFEDSIQLELYKFEFPKIFNCHINDIDKTIIELIKSKKIYFDGGHYFFINDKNYKRVMLYMNELVNFLNDAYKDLKLTEIEII